MGSAPMGRPPVNIIRNIYRQYLENAALILLIVGLSVIVIDITLSRIDEATRIEGSTISSTWSVVLSVVQFSREVAFAFLIAALLIFTTEKRSKDELLSIFDDNIEDIKNTINTGLSDIGNIVRISGFLGNLNSSQANSIVRIVGENIYRRFIIGLDATHHGFTLQDADWAMSSNELFYQALIDHNIRDQEVRVTHTGDLDTWLDDYEPSETLRIQKDLILNNNIKMTRIFIGTMDLSENKAKKYIDVMRKMEDNKIITGYVRHSTPSDIMDMTWLPDLNIFMTWKPRASGKIALIEFSSDNTVRSQLERDWNFVIARANLAS
jgi:hypothetical protein